MADLSLNLCGVHLKNPIIAASGTFGFGREYDELYDISALGGISVKGLCLGGRITGDFEAFDIVEAWLTNEFEGGRHCISLNLINDAEEALMPRKGEKVLDPAKANG